MEHTMKEKEMKPMKKKMARMMKHKKTKKGMK